MRISLHLTLAILCSCCCFIAGGVLGALATLYTAVALHAHGIDPPQVIGLLMGIGFPVAGAAVGVKLSQILAIRYLPARCPQCAGRASLRYGRRGATPRYRRPFTYFCRNCGYIYITSHGGRGWTYEGLLGPDWEEQIKLEVARAEGLKHQPVKSHEAKPHPKNEGENRPNHAVAVVERMPAGRVERTLAVAYVLSGPVLYVVAPLLTASGYVLWQVGGRPGWGLELLLGGIATFVFVSVFRAWVVRWGRRRWPSPYNPGQNPTDAGSSRPDAVAVASAVPGATSLEAQPQQIAFLGVMGLICLAFGIPGLVIGTSGAFTDFRKVETTGVILETRINDRPKHTGARWDKEGLIEYVVGGQVCREWAVIERHFYYRDKNDRGGVGQTRAVWYDPESPEKVTANRPAPWASVRGAAFSGLFAIAGVLSELAVGITFLRRWRGRRT